MNTITVDRIEETRTSTRLVAMADTEAMFHVIAWTEAGPIVEAARTKVLGRLIQTGRKVDRRGLVRVRIEFARDTGDVAGTLAFGATHVGGFARAEVFAP